MLDQDATYPTAVASKDATGVDAAIAWSLNHMQDGDTLSVWTKLKANLRNNERLNSLVSRHSNVEHVVGRGGGFVRGPGPVLMAWANMDDIGQLVEFSAHHIRSLCVITWNEKWLSPWVASARPTILGDGSAWREPTAPLDPVVVEAMKDLTMMINHNNTVLAGYEKDDVVSTLLALRSAGFPLDGEAMQAWALAHGWSGENPKHLANYVTAINGGKRPQSTRRVSVEYVDRLRRRAESGSEEA